MDPIFKNILAVIAGCIVGMLVNFGFISLGAHLIPAPEGVNPEDINSLKENMHLFTPKHFITPFLAHAGGTLAGAYVAARIAAKYKLGIALTIGGFFLLGGVAMVMMVPAPQWFSALDLIVAYIPMAWLGAKLAGTQEKNIA